MTFEENGIYYIRGVVSVNPSRNDNHDLCDPKQFVIFTDVAKYVSWIEEVVPQVKRLAPRTGTDHQSVPGKYCLPAYIRFIKIKFIKVNSRDNVVS